MKDLRTLALLSLALFGFGMMGCETSTPVDDDDDDSSMGDDDDDDSQGGIELDAQQPEDGEQNFYYRYDIWAEFDGDIDASSTITVDGVTGTVAVEGARVTFTPDTPLESLTEYSWTVSASGDGATVEETFSFRTSDFGTAAAGDPPSTGSFVVDLASANIVEPPGVGSVLSSFLEDPVRLTVTNFTATTIDVEGALGDTQDLCSETIGITGGEFENPFFQVGPGDFTFTVEGVSVPIGNMLINGSFAPDYSAFGGGILAGSIDARDIDDVVGGEPGSGAACELILAFGIECEPCPSDNQPFCLTLLAQDIAADYDASVTVTPRTSEDIAGDPACQ